MALKDMNREAQRSLTALGYPLKVDGIWGRRSRGALRAFARKVGVPADGELSQPWAVALLSLAELVRPAAVELPDGLTIHNGKLFLRKDMPRRDAPPTQIVIHEPVVTSVDTTHRALVNKGLSVEYMADRDGRVTKHVPDVAIHHCQHAGGDHNDRSVAIEVINGYYPSRAVSGQDIVEAVWAHRGKYALPTLAQVESVWLLVAHLTDRFPTIPLHFPGYVDGRFRWGRHADGEHEPGIMAHHRWAHADGLFIEHYCLCRSHGHAPESAWALTLDAATAGKRWTTLGAS